MTFDDLLMQIQDTDELLYTNAESELMLEYRDNVEQFQPTNDEQVQIKNELLPMFKTLSDLIIEFNDRIELTADNPAEPSAEEVASLKRLFDKIETLDFKASDRYRFLLGKRI